MSPQRPRIAVIGAGVAGVSCARILAEAGYHTTVFEKSRGVGGRLAARRGVTPEGGPLAFDHGAQYITAKTPGFAAELESAHRSGTMAIWTPDRPGSFEAKRRYVGQPAMNAPLKYWLDQAGQINLKLGCEIASVSREGAGWNIAFTDRPEAEFFDLVICTAPAPQAARLLAEEKAVAQALAEVEMAPCWALMMALKERVETGFDAHGFENCDISWLARNSAKPGRPDGPDCWVAHASPEWSRLNLELSPQEAREALMDAVRAALGLPLPKPVFSSAHRWRYARTIVPLGAPYLASIDQTLFVGGDWCLGARVEEAYLSGYAMAKAALQQARQA